MKINSCQFNDSYFPIMDGVGMTVHNYADWLNSKYGESVVVVPKVKGYRDVADYKVYRFKSMLLPGMNPYRVGLPFVDVSFKKNLKKQKIDIAHAHCPFISGQIALKLARKNGIPLVTTFHTKYREDFKRMVSNEPLLDYLMDYSMEFYKKADHVWVPNNATGMTLREYGFTGEYEVMANGCDIEIPDKHQLMKMRKKGLEESGAGKDDFVLLFVGQHRWEKNVRMVIEALKQLISTGEDFHMIFVGEGYAQKEMKNMVKQLELADRVHFAGVITDRTRLLSYYAAADLFLFPSLYDNSPLVIQEAAAFGLPSIVVKNSSAAEPVIDGVNGFIVGNDPEFLARQIHTLMFKPQVVKKAGQGAQKSLYHPWESIADEVYFRYKDIIKEFRKKKKHAA